MTHPRSVSVLASEAVASALGGERPLGVGTPALVLVVGAVTLGGQSFYSPERAALHPA